MVFSTLESGIFALVVHPCAESSFQLTVSDLSAIDNAFAGSGIDSFDSNDPPCHFLFHVKSTSPVFKFTDGATELLPSIE